MIKPFYQSWLLDVYNHTSGKPFYYHELPQSLKSNRHLQKAKSCGAIRQLKKYKPKECNGDRRVLWTFSKVKGVEL